MCADRDGNLLITEITTNTVKAFRTGSEICSFSTDVDGRDDECMAVAIAAADDGRIYVGRASPTIPADTHVLVFGFEA